MSSELSVNATGFSAVNSAAATPDLQGNLRRLDQLANLGIVSASVAHEIKNGLVAINTFINILLEQGTDREMAEMVQRELKRIDGLATQMLRLSAPKPAALTTVRVHDVLEHAMRLLEHQFSSRLIAVKKNYNAVTDTVRADESQLQQAFMNLLLNAAEAMGGQGELWLATETADEARLKIFIRDTGPGIAPENLLRLFEPFFTTKKLGTGLGLAICQRVLLEHLGSIEVKSELGRGSTFIITLPVV
jgi:signal transduction histidine kinase